MAKKTCPKTLQSSQILRAKLQILTYPGPLPLTSTISLIIHLLIHFAQQKKKFSIKDFFSKCGQILVFMRICCQYQQTLITPNFTLCAFSFCKIWYLLDSFFTFFALFCDILLLYQIDTEWMGITKREIQPLYYFQKNFLNSKYF